MPSFHTKTIESILEPVAKQVSKLIILHDQSADGSPMPDLHGYVSSVKQAVHNLVQVGLDTSRTTDDEKFKQELPYSLRRVEDAAQTLQLSADILRSDPYSNHGKRKLIEGSKGILQGTGSLLCVFDSSEVRKIIAHCQAVLDVLSVVEVVDAMDHLVEFVKNLSPCLSRMTKEVDIRIRDLMHASNRQMLTRSLEKVRNFTPMLISSIKMFITTEQMGNLGVSDARANRDFTHSQMTDTILAMIELLQLTTDYTHNGHHEVEELSRLKALRNSLEYKADEAHKWLASSNGVVYGSSSNRAVSQLLEDAGKISQLSTNISDRQSLAKSIAELESLVQSLTDLRTRQEGDSLSTLSLARSCQEKLSSLLSLSIQVANSIEKSGCLRPPPLTLRGKLSQAQRWLCNLCGPERGAGLIACRALAEEGYRFAKETAGLKDLVHQTNLLSLCDDVNRLTDRLQYLSMAPDTAKSSEAFHVSVDLCRSLVMIYERLQVNLIHRASETLVDLYTPIENLCEMGKSPLYHSGREGYYEEELKRFKDHSHQICITAELAASGAGETQRADHLRLLASEIFGLTAQLGHAARLLLILGTEDAARTGVVEHVDLLKQQWLDLVDKLRIAVDEVMDSGAFIQAQELGILRDTEHTEESIKQSSKIGVVEHTTFIARRANRVMQVAKLEADNSEDIKFVDQLNEAVKELRATVTPMVQSAKGLVTNISDPQAIDEWRASNRVLIKAVSGVRIIVGPHQASPYSPTSSQKFISSPNNSKPLKFRFPSGTPVKSSSSSSSITWTPNSGGPGTIRPGPYSPGYSSPALAREISQLMLDDSFQRKIKSKKQENCRPSALWQNGYDEPPVYKSQARMLKIRRPESQSSPSFDSSTEQDADDDFNFPIPLDDQPIMAAAHTLHQEALQWSSKDNQLIAAVKRMAALMARLGQIVQGEWGTKKDLIDVARKIAEASEGVTQCAKSLSRDCLDKRMRTNLLQKCERIPTIATQLYILSTVKATMLQPPDDQSLVDEDVEEATVVEGTDEDMEATDMVVLNAQNLMQAVIDTLNAAEASSIKIRVDSGIQMRWTRQRPWFKT